MALNLEQFDVYSWKEEEYLVAVKNDEFFFNVKAALDSGLQIDSPREDLVRSKLYFAGGSARWMFLFPTKSVIQQTDESVVSVDDIIPYIKGTVGDQSNNVVNRLFSSSLAENDDMFPRKKSIISRFAGVLLAIKAGPDLIRNLARATRHDGNPSMDGWMLEMWFFASLRHGGVKLFDKSNEEFQTWPESNVKTLDINSFPALPENKGVWFKPSKWNQGGFDAIFMDKGKGLVKFVQVTRGDTHSFKIGRFREFLDALHVSKSLKVKVLEIVFVVEQSKLANFKIQNPTGPGSLAEFGWVEGEERKRVTIVGIHGWCDH